MRGLLTAALFTAGISVGFAQDAAALYQSKCVACHGPKGAGKPAIKGTNLLTDEAKKASADDLKEMILNGGKAKKATHIFSTKGVSADQAKGLVAFIRDLQK